MPSEAPPPVAPTVVAVSRGERALIWGGFPLLGAGAGWLLKALAGWVVSLPWAPFQGPFELVDSLPDPQATIGAAAIGAVVGLVVAFLAIRSYLRVTVGVTEVTVAGDDDSPRTVPRADVVTAFRDGSDLVLLGRGSEELVRAAGDVDLKALAAAFREHGYPWRDDGDPYRDRYRRWVKGLPELSTGADALFAARAKALEKDDKDDIRQLRDELATLGIVVRDDKKTQYWRSTTPALRDGDESDGRA